MRARRAAPFKEKVSWGEVVPMPTRSFPGSMTRVLVSMVVVAETVSVVRSAVEFVMVPLKEPERVPETEVPEPLMVAPEMVGLEMVRGAAEEPERLLMRCERESSRRRFWRDCSKEERRAASDADEGVALLRAVPWRRAAR
jgi:hypothetical protein